MLWRLPIVLPQIKAGNISENLLIEIRLIIHYLYQAKEITKSIQQYNEFDKVLVKLILYLFTILFDEIDTIFMNSENSKTSDPDRVNLSILLNLLDKINVKRRDKYVGLSNLSIYYAWKNIKKSFKNNKFKRWAPTWNNKFELLDGLYSVSHIQDYFEYILKKHGEETDNPSIRIYVNKIENRITFKIKTGYYLELLTPEAMKLLRSTNIR